MYFDLAPKTKREDLYDFDAEYDDLLNLLKGRIAWAPLIVVRGLRRLGKTSLIKTVLNELGVPHLIIDGKAFADKPVIKKKDLLKELQRALNEMQEQRKWWEKDEEFIKGIEWIKLDSKPPFIHFEWRKPARDMDIMDIFYWFNYMARENKTKFVLVIDEAQEFRKLADYDLTRVIFHIYEHIEETQVVVSGSQVGLLNDFLKLDDPEAALFGRGTADIEVPRLPDNRAAEFLRRGFEQAGARPDERTIEEAISKLDGTIGWLTLFGYEAIMKPQGALERTIEKGSEMAATELEHFLESREEARRRYVAILKAAAQWKDARWTTLKETVETWAKKGIDDKNFSTLLENLVKANFLAKKDALYYVPDPLLLRAIQKGLVR